MKPDATIIAAQYPEKQRVRRGWAPVPRAVIEVTQLDDGRWCWGYDWCTSLGGAGFAALPKLGHFAPTRDRALRDAATAMFGDIERRARRERIRQPFAPLLAWLDGLLAERQLDLFDTGE